MTSLSLPEFPWGSCVRLGIHFPPFSWTSSAVKCPTHSSSENFKSAKYEGPYQSGSAKCSSLKKENETLAYVRKHEVNLTEVKRREENLKHKHDISYTVTVSNVGHHLAAKDSAKD